KLSGKWLLTFSSSGGKPISESLESVKIPCVFVPPENRFQYVWKMLIPDHQSLILPNDSAILEVHRDTHPVAFECDTRENDELIASVKYTVYTTEGKLTEDRQNPQLLDLLTSYPQSLYLAQAQLQFMGSHPAHSCTQASVQDIHSLSWLRCYREKDLSVISILMTSSPKAPDDHRQWLHIDVKIGDKIVPCGKPQPSL
uniref:Uncharacterized protein n=1 Tax=Salvator merianae TaxID=96440 RepID=A0A8D0DVX9_SALMN